MTCRVIQVTNISTQCQKEQIRALFAHLGRIDEIQLYPDSETLTASVGAKVAYIKYDKSEIAQVALQLTNTVFIDRPLLCSLVRNGKIPDETEAVKYCAPLNPNITLICGGATWPNTVINRVVGTGPTSLIETIDPALAERSLPPYPPLPGTMDPLKTEEIRRTIYVSNIPSNVSLDNLNDLFSQIGEIRFIRFAGDENAPIKSAYIEFSEQPYIVRGLCLNGLQFGGKHLKVNHATCAIIKPATSKQLFATKDKSPKHSSSQKKSKSPDSYRTSKKRSRSPRRHSSSRRSRSKKRSKSPHKHSSSSKRHDHERDKRKRSSSKSKKRSRSKDRKRSRSKDLKKRRSTSKSRDHSNKSSKKSSSSTSKSSRNRSRSRQRKEIKKIKSDSNSPNRVANNKIINKNSEELHIDKKEEIDIEKHSNGNFDKNDGKYGPNPPPKSSKDISSSSSDDSNSSFNSSSSEAEDEKMQV